MRTPDDGQAGSSRQGACRVCDQTDSPATRPGTPATQIGTPATQTGNPTTLTGTPATQPGLPSWAKEALLLAAAALAGIASYLLGKAAGRPGAPPWQATLSWLIFAAAYLAAGRDVLLGAARNIRKGRVFDELFLMSIASLGAFAIGAMEEALGVMIFYKIGEMFQERAVLRSRASIQSLLKLRPDTARVRRDGVWHTLPAADVQPGDAVQVRPGERVPVDGTILEGHGSFDTAAMTGESLPRQVGPGDSVLAGFMAVDAALVIRADKPVSASSAARIMTLVEHASAAKAGTELLVTRLARWYTPAVVIGALVVAVLPPLAQAVLTGSLPAAQLFRDWAYRALVMLVISCPCALVLSIPLSYFAGLGGAARQGILMKGAWVMDALADAGTVVFDKTGTLTDGHFSIQALLPHEGFSADGLLQAAAAAGSHSNHPLAQAIKTAWRDRGGKDPACDTGSYSEIAGHGTLAMLDGQEVLAGADRLLHLKAIPHDCPHQDRPPGTPTSPGIPALPGTPTPPGIPALPGTPTSPGIPATLITQNTSATQSTDATIVHVAMAGRYAGRIELGDTLKTDSSAAVRSLRRLGIRRIVMLTGDTERAARQAALAIGLDEVHHGLLPEHKLRRLESMLTGTARRRSRRSAVLFVGDGINDAPVLARADAGIAMGLGGSDAAVESADVVLMSASPMKVAEAIDRARRTRAIVMQNIVFALGFKLVFLAFGAFGLAAMWQAVIADVGVALVAVLNATRALKKLPHIGDAQE